MPIIKPDFVGKKGDADAKRHRDLQRDRLLENLPEVEESIITKKKRGTVKIPIKKIDIPHFRPSRKGKGVGVGQGKGKPGDIIGKKPGKKNGKGKDGKPGSEPGEDYIETEVPIEEYIEMMLEDCGLPRLEEKRLKEFIVQIGWKIKGITRSGPEVHLHVPKTAKEGHKRFWTYLGALEAETGRDRLTCFSALKEAGGTLDAALELLEDPEYTAKYDEVTPWPIIGEDEKRYHKVTPNVEPQSRAVVVAMMDISGSMTKEKKYLARSMLFWLVEFLRQMYEQVEIRFIVHHTTARLVDEETFFKTGESGGTRCASAYELANNLVESEYPTSMWNTYVWHFSDGEDFDSDATMKEVKKLLGKDINMLGYGQIQTPHQRSEIMDAFKNSFSYAAITDPVYMLSGKKDPFLCVEVNDREDLLPALKAFLKKDRWAQ